MEKYYIKEVNATTGKEIEREMTQDEFDMWQKANEVSLTEKLAYENQIQKRKSALNKLIDLGLTEEEIAAL